MGHSGSSLCLSCLSARSVRGRLGQRYVLCENTSVSERYPAQPRLRCAAFAPVAERTASGLRTVASGVPVLRTDRLRLRGHGAGDLDAVAALWSDPEVVRHIVGRPQSREESWQRLMRYVGHWSLVGYGFWVVEERETGKMVGEIGLGQFRREIDPPFGDDPEIGWVIAGSAQGKGYATEAGAAVVDWREHSVAGTGTVAIIAPENAASLKVAEKLGFVEMGRALYRGEQTIVLRRG